MPPPPPLYNFWNAERACGQSSGEYAFLEFRTGGRIIGTSLTSYTTRLAVTLFSRIFTGEGTLGYIGCDSTEHRGQKQYV
jgi:hypothetical protein